MQIFCKLFWAIKIIDFGKAKIFRDSKEREMIFRVSVRKDFMEFILSFVGAIISPEKFTDVSSGALVQDEGFQFSLGQYALMLDENFALFERAEYPETPNYQQVWDGFRAMQEITDGGQR